MAKYTYTREFVNEGLAKVPHSMIYEFYDADTKLPVITFKCTLHHNNVSEEQFHADVGPACQDYANLVKGMLERFGVDHKKD